MAKKWSPAQKTAFGMAPNGKARAAVREKEAKKRQPTPEQQAFLAACKANGIPEPVEELGYVEPKVVEVGKKLFDFCWPMHDVGLIVLPEEGDVRDLLLLGMELTGDGWSVLYCTWVMVADGSVWKYLKVALLGE